MSLRSNIIKYYQEALALAPYPDEMKRALKGGERVPQFIDRMVMELGKVHLKIKPMTLKLAVYDMTGLFLKLVYKHAQERGMSELAKVAMQEKAKKVALAKDIVDVMDEGGEVGEEVLDL